MGNYVVYKHTSPSGKVYIGITSKKPYKRRNGGLGYINNAHFTRAINKYGWNNIIHEIVFTGLSKEEAEAKEIELIAYYKSDNRAYGYNIEHGGNSVGKMAEETKLKIGVANKGKTPWILGKHHSEETKNKIREAQKGRKLSDEIKRKISVAHKGKKQSKESIEKRVKKLRGQKRTAETRRKISEGNKGKIVVQSEETKAKISRTMSTAVLCIETNVVYYGMREAERQANIASGSISKCCKGDLQTAGGYHWKVIQTI